MAENSLEDIRNGGIFTFGLAFDTYHRHQLRFTHFHIMNTYKQDNEVVLCHTVRLVSTRSCLSFYEKKHSTEQSPGNLDEERLLKCEDDTALEALKVSNEWGTWAMMVYKIHWNLKTEYRRIEVYSRQL